MDLKEPEFSSDLDPSLEDIFSILPALPTDLVPEDIGERLKLQQLAAKVYYEIVVKLVYPRQIAEQILQEVHPQHWPLAVELLANDMELNPVEVKLYPKPAELELQQLPADCYKPLPRDSKDRSGSARKRDPQAAKKRRKAANKARKRSRA